MRFLIALPVLLFLLGTYKGFQQGAPDFHVFYFASQLVAERQFSDLYTVSPDRFLYAPGFAWLMLPFALFPFKISYALWSLLKGVFFAGMLRVLYRRAGVLATTLGVVFFSRPLLIDLRYGQINLVILSLAVIAIDQLCEPRSRRKELAVWFVFSISALSKLFPATLLLGTLRSRIARAASAIGLAFVLFMPIMGVGFDGLFGLYRDWFGALQSKGLPIDTHNQSFIAFMLRVFSNTPAPSLQLGGTVHTHGFALLSSDTSLFLGKLAILAIFTVLVTGIVKFSKHRSFDRAMILIALLALPSHLIWKPYFIFSIPLLAIAFSRALQQRARGVLAALISLAVLLSCSSYEFIGREWAAHLDAWSLFFWVDVIAIVISARVLAKSPQTHPSV